VSQTLVTTADSWVYVFLSPI